MLHGGVYAGELCYYPGIANLRALPKTWEITAAPPPLAPASQTIAQAFAGVQQAYAENPLHERCPLRVDNLRLARRDDQLALTDGEQLLPLELAEDQRLRLLATTDGAPFCAFLLYEYDTRALRLLSFSDSAGKLNVY